MPLTILEIKNRVTTEEGIHHLFPVFYATHLRQQEKNND